MFSAPYPEILQSPNPESGFLLTFDSMMFLIHEHLSVDTFTINQQLNYGLKLYFFTYSKSKIPFTTNNINATTTAYTSRVTAKNNTSAIPSIIDIPFIAGLYFPLLNFVNSNFIIPNITREKYIIQNNK